jgi:hypothetical protein
MKCGLNKINTKFTQQARWLGGIGVEFHPWGPRIKLCKWHCCDQCQNIDWMFYT